MNNKFEITIYFTNSQQLTIQNVVNVNPGKDWVSFTVSEDEAAPFTRTLKAENIIEYTTSVSVPTPPAPADESVTAEVA
jgi:hypothetical protein